MKEHQQSPTQILVAEDSRTQAEQLGFMLEQNGYAVTIAANGKLALQAAQAQKPALIISDIVMPEMDGYELCKAIKLDDKLKDIPVILVTTLSDSQDVIRGLECGADNFIRKPYDERYLLSRIEYLLMNLDLRRGHKMQLGVEIDLGGHKHFINAERQQILDLLISTYEQAIHINVELKQRETELVHSNQVLQGLFGISEGLNRVVSSREVAEIALEQALKLPGIRAGWISIHEKDSGFKIVAARNLPPALATSEALDGDCECRGKLLSGELDSVTNIIKCERLANAKGDTQGLRCHASVPFAIDAGRTLGILNLAGEGEGLFNEDELKVLHNVGQQLAVSLERARLHEHLEQLVEARTAALRDSEARMRTIIDAEPECVKVVDAEGRLVQMNAAGLAMLDADSLQQVLGGRIAEFVVPAQREAYRAFEAGVLDGKCASFEFEIVGLKGRHLWLDSHAVPLSDPQDGRPQMLAITRDVTQRRANEAKIKRLNRIYAVLSGINTTIVRVRDEGELFREACRIAVEHGRFIFAWIGGFDADTRLVTPAAQAGRDDGYLEQINLSAREDAPGGCALTAQALAEKKPVICNDIASDERMAAWSAEALSRGYRSVTVFPLLIEAQPAGVFALYAAEPDAFDEEEMRLLIEMAGDISFAMEHLKKVEKLNYLAYFDAITGLPNRALFYDRLGQHLLDSQSGETLAVLAIDLEHFRNINESFGRHAGDAVLKQTAERLIHTGVGVDHLARISADCFGMVLSDKRDEADVMRFLEGQVTPALGKPFELDGKTLRISARAGIAIFPDDGTDADTLYRNAEAALKKTKKSGDKYLFYTPEFNAKAAERLTLENKLRQALELGQFVLYYQPKINLKDGHICALEALIRWQDPEDGLVPPMKFISILEENGMILDVGRWALQQAVADTRQWLQSGLQPPRVAVNVSAIQLRQNDFVDTVKKVLGDNAGAAQYLDLEITESLIMQDIEANIQKLNVIREMGLEVAIDDFGTGYSSLSYIAKLPVNTLKIDRAFIINMANNPDDLSIVAAIISLAHSLDMKVVAEGVETREQANLLRLLKCDEIQGFLFSPAVPAQQISVFLQEKKSLPV